MPTPLKVLLVEDDPDDAYFMQLAFSQVCGVSELRVATDGDQAVAWLGGEGRFADREAYPLPDHVLLDLKLPRRSGLDVLRWIRAHEEHGSLRVTVLSGSELRRDVTEAEALGVFGYIQKPVSLDGFHEAVRTFCERAGSR